jgi:hypothetical protein
LNARKFVATAMPRAAADEMFNVLKPTTDPASVEAMTGS